LQARGGLLRTLRARHNDDRAGHYRWSARRRDRHRAGQARGVRDSQVLTSHAGALMSVYNIDVTWNDLHMGFTEVTGLDRSAALTLKRGVLDRRLWTAWCGATGSSPAASQTLVIRVLDERRRLIGTWTVRN